MPLLQPTPHLWLPVSPPPCLGRQLLPSWEGSSPTTSPLPRGPCTHTALGRLRGSCPLLGMQFTWRLRAAGRCSCRDFLLPSNPLPHLIPVKEAYHKDNPPAWGTQRFWELAINSLNKVVLLLTAQLLTPPCNPPALLSFEE